MKLKRLLLACLVVSVSANIVLFLGGMKPGGDCPDIASYGIPTPIGMEDARRTVDAYKASVEPEAVTGGVITGSTLHDLFCAPGTNGLAYHLAKDESGTIAGGGIFLVLEGVSVVAEGNNITSMQKTGTALFMPGNWCPPNCASVE